MHHLVRYAIFRLLWKVTDNSAARACCEAIFPLTDITEESSCNSELRPISFGEICYVANQKSLLASHFVLGAEVSILRIPGQGSERR